MDKKEYNKLSAKVMEEWQKRLNEKESLAMAMLLKRWDENVVGKLKKLIEELLNKNVLSQNQLFKLNEYKELLRVAEEEVKKYAEYSSLITSQLQTEALKISLNNSDYFQSLITPSFGQLNKDAINSFIGKSAEGTPLYDILYKRFGENVEKSISILLEGIATGRNPNKVAEDMIKALDISKYDAARIARTESISTLHNSTVESYKSGGVVESVIWMAEPNACDECMELENKSPYSLDQVPDLPHPFCKCAIAPNI